MSDSTSLAAGESRNSGCLPDFTASFAWCCASRTWGNIATPSEVASHSLRFTRRNLRESLTLSDFYSTIADHATMHTRGRSSRSQSPGHRETMPKFAILLLSSICRGVLLGRGHLIAPGCLPLSPKSRPRSIEWLPIPLPHPKEHENSLGIRSRRWEVRRRPAPPHFLHSPLLQPAK